MKGKPMLKSTGPGLDKLAELLANSKGGKQKKSLASKKEAAPGKKKMLFGKEE